MKKEFEYAETKLRYYNKKVGVKCAYLCEFYEDTEGERGVLIYDEGEIQYESIDEYSSNFTEIENELLLVMHLYDSAKIVVDLEHIEVDGLYLPKEIFLQYEEGLKRTKERIDKLEESGYNVEGLE